MDFIIFGRNFSIFSDDRQWQKFLDFVFSYFTRPAAIATVVLLLLCVCFICLALATKKKRKLSKMAALSCYILIMFMLSVFNRTTGAERELRIAIDPWLSGESAYHESNILIALVDCIYFVPYGLLIRWQHTSHVQWKSLFGIIVGTGLVIETLQFILMRGVASLEDLLAYTIGGMIGIGIMHLKMRGS